MHMPSKHTSLVYVHIFMNEYLWQLKDSKNRSFLQVKHDFVITEPCTLNSALLLKIKHMYQV